MIIKNKQMAMHARNKLTDVQILQPD